MTRVALPLLRDASVLADGTGPVTVARRLASVPVRARASAMPDAKSLYAELLHARLDDPQARSRARNFLDQCLARIDAGDDDLPASFEDGAQLHRWMLQSAQRATQGYQAYLAGRKAGAPRTYFSSRGHALHFLQSIAPTKLVDGSWLYGVLAQRDDERLGGLIDIYLEELGDGEPGKNHVLLYRRLLKSLGLNQGTHLAGPYFEQGAIQLALGLTAQELLPEVIGFNLGYEQLPLHLLITAYELNELGIDPYYFTLHVTVDNTASGHAVKAVDAVMENSRREADPREFLRRVRQGYLLNDVGMGVSEVLAAFKPEDEVVRILEAKCAAGAGAHSDYCRLEGRTVNEWLAQPEGMRRFLEVLQAKGWIVPGNPEGSRFWQLLRGERAEMFGVFDGYELQLIYDWIRGEAARDGRPYDSPPPADDRPARLPTFRALQRRRPANDAGPVDVHDTPAWAQCAANDGMHLLGPANHWTPEGLAATRAFRQMFRHG